MIKHYSFKNCKETNAIELFSIRKYVITNQKCEFREKIYSEIFHFHLCYLHIKNEISQNSNRKTITSLINK